MSQIAKQALSKHIKKGKAPVSKRPQTSKGGANKRNIGEATAKRMQDKAGNMKKRPMKGMDEEIESGDEEEDMNLEDDAGKKKGALTNDPFF